MLQVNCSDRTGFASVLAKSFVQETKKTHPEDHASEWRREREIVPPQYGHEIYI
jgi:hypothetical protein